MEEIEINQNFDSFELSSGLLCYSMDRLELIDYFQPHSIDIAIIERFDKKYLDSVIKFLQFKSTILIVDKDGTFEVLNKAMSGRDNPEFLICSHGYEKSGEGVIEDVLGNIKVYEYVKLDNKSIIKFFLPAISPDILSLLIIGEFDYDSIYYNEVYELLPLLDYSYKKARNLIMPIEYKDLDKTAEFFFKKKHEATSINSKAQFELF